MRRLTTRASRFFGEYTADLSADDVQRLFTRDTAEAYRFFARGIDRDALQRMSPFKRWVVHARMFFLAFAMRLSPPRRVLYAVALVAARRCPGDARRDAAGEAGLHARDALRLVLNARSLALRAARFALFNFQAPSRIAREAKPV
jgi:hypothetical protein